MMIFAWSSCVAPPVCLCVCRCVGVCLCVHLNYNNVCMLTIAIYVCTMCISGAMCVCCL